MKKILLSTDPTGKCKHCALARKDIPKMCKKYGWFCEANNTYEEGK